MTKKSDLNFDLKQLRSFLKIVHEKSFTNASRKLKIGQSTISHQIHSLEEMLGVKLFNRIGKELSVTNEGNNFKGFCEKLFDDIDDLKIKFSNSSPATVTKIAVSTIPSTYIIPEAVAKVSKKYPGFHFNVGVCNSREVIESVKEGQVEIGVAGRMIKHPGLEYKLIYSDEIVLVAHSSSPDELNLNEISELPFVSRESGSGTRNAYEKALQEHGIIPSKMRIVYECTTSEAIKESAVSGIGYSFISKLSIANELQLNKLKIIKIKGLKIIREFYVVYSRSRDLTAPAKMMVDALSELKTRK